jgi:hypothetical protein
MLDFRPQIVHFCGHGAGNGGLALEDEAEKVQLVDAEALASLFQLFATQLDCVLLNACYSEVQANAISQHINYVIGMNQAIGDKAAIEFAVGFYDALGAGESFDFAYKIGCNAIQLNGGSEHLTPAIKKKAAPDGGTATESHNKNLWKSTSQEFGATRSHHSAPENIAATTRTS